MTITAGPVRTSYDVREARIISNQAMEAAPCGYKNSGLPKQLNMPGDPRFGAPHAATRTVRETTVSELIDDGNAVGR